MSRGRTRVVVLLAIPACAAAIGLLSDFAGPLPLYLVVPALVSGVAMFRVGARRSVPLWMLATAAITFVLLAVVVFFSIDWNLNECPSGRGFCDWS